MQFVQVKAARFTHTSQSGSAFKGRGADAADEGADAETTIAAVDGLVGGGEARRSAAVEDDAASLDGDGPQAAPAFFPPLIFGIGVSVWEHASVASTPRLE